MQIRGEGAKSLFRALRRSGYREYVLLILTLCYAVQSLDRSVLVIMAQPIKSEFGLSDAQMGLLTGFVFTIPYGLMTLPAGYLADRANKRTVLAIALAIWSSLTLLTGFVRNLWQLAAMRSTIAVAEAFYNPSAIPIVADHYQRTSRGKAMSILFCGQPLASVLGFPLLASIADQFGWRAAFFTAGAPGLLLAIILVLTMRDSRRTDAAPSAPSTSPSPNLKETFSFIFRQRSALHVAFGASLSIVAYTGHSAWTAPLLMRAHALSLTDAGWVMSLSIGVMSVLGHLVGGILVDHLARKDIRWFALAPAFIVLITGGFQIASDLAPSPTATIALLTIWALVYGFLVGPVMGVLQSLVLPQMRGVASSCIIISFNVVGAGLGPLVVGILSDTLSGGAPFHSIQLALALVSLLQIWAAAHFFLAMRTLTLDLARAEAAD